MYSHGCVKPGYLHMIIALLINKWISIQIRMSLNTMCGSCFYKYILLQAYRTSVTYKFGKIILMHFFSPGQKNNVLKGTNYFDV